MNKPMDPDAPRLSEKAVLRLLGLPVPFAGREAKEMAKRERRTERRNRQTEKRFWLDS